MLSPAQRVIVCSLCLGACVTAPVLLSGCGKKKKVPRADSVDCMLDPKARKLMNAASAGCLLVIDEALLVTRIGGHGDEQSGKVTPPGGAREDGETARCAAVRQTYEETGLKVRAGELFGVWRNDFHLFICQLIDRAEVAKARDRSVPKSADKILEKLLLELPSMKNRHNGKRELWAHPTNVVITAGWKSLKTHSAIPPAVPVTSTDQ